MKEGWFCPRCETIYAPWVPSCNCSKPKQEQPDADYTEEEIARLRAEYDRNVEI